MQTETTATQIPDSSNSDVDTDIEEKQSPKKDEVDISVRRALDTLEELSQKKMRNLTIRDRIKVQKCFNIVMKNSTIEFSTKGHSSGSRVKIDNETVHLPHGRDRMSPGAQHKIKRRIEESQQHATASHNKN